MRIDRPLEKDENRYNNSKTLFITSECRYVDWWTVYRMFGFLTSVYLYLARRPWLDPIWN